MTWPGTAAIGCRWPRTLGRQWIHRSPTILRPVPQGTRAFFVQNARRAPTIRSDSQVEGCCGSMDFQMGTVEAWRSLQSHCTVQHLAVAVSGDFWSLNSCFIFVVCHLISNFQGKKWPAIPLVMWGIACAYPARTSRHRDTTRPLDGSTNPVHMPVLLAFHPWRWIPIAPWSKNWSQRSLPFAVFQKKDES